MDKFLIVVIILLNSCSYHNQKKFIITDENYKFDISNNLEFKKSVTSHFDNFGIGYNIDDIIVLDINEKKNSLYKNILQNNIHTDYLSRNPEDVFNLISLIDDHDKKVLQECINAFLRYHSFKTL